MIMPLEVVSKRDYEVLNLESQQTGPTNFQPLWNECMNI